MSKNAWAICDRCGTRARYDRMREEVQDARPTGVRVCPWCFDEDHPQYLVGKVPVSDDMTLPFARPDTSLPAARAFTGWNPVAGLTMDLAAGAVRAEVT